MQVTADDFIRTIASDDEISIASGSSDDEQERQESITPSIHPTFEFENDDFLPIREHIEVEDPSLSEKETSENDEIVEEMKLQTALTRIKNENKDASADAEQKAKELEFYDQKIKVKQANIKCFTDLKLCRPLLRAINAMGFTQPTSIQQYTVPIALSGKDICASAQTGSGKTAAFLIPILERLHLRNHRIAATRVLIICPVRELATQCHSVLQSLSRFSEITSVLVVGGLPIKAQELELRARPDIVICTPGRMIDHLRNSPSVHLDDLEILVLDEADRLLELGFTEEIQELTRMCPKARQTMLFSATMTSKIDQLVSLSMKRPVRISTDPLFDVSKHLVQEFVRIRPTREDDRDAILLALCTRTFKHRTIVFMETKIHAHRMAILFRLSKIKAAELHGDLNQQERQKALEDFRDGHVEILLATDVAARGIDVKGVHAVINYEMPKDITTYVHRVGRTARAGRIGRAVTLTSESRRLVMKEVTRHCHGVVQSRCVPDSVIVQWKAKIQSMQTDITSALKDEKVEKGMRKAEEEALRVQNLIQFRDEIHSRPARTWFLTEKEKKHVQDRAKQEHKAPEHIASPKKENKASQLSRAEKLKTMNRKKRRLFEIREREQELSKGSDESIAIKPVFTEKHVVAAAKRIKRAQNVQQFEEKEESIAELSNRKRKTREKNRKAKSDSLFNSDRSSKSAIHSRTPKAFEFKEKNSDSKRHSKKSKNAFKSKGRYQRRR